MAEIDFNEVITELNELGLTDYRIAKLVGTQTTNIYMLRTKPGRQPLYSLGTRLMRLLQKERDNSVGMNEKGQ